MKYWMVVLIIVGCCFIVLAKIDPNNLRVDRWIMINNWLNNIFHGIHPYLPLNQGINIPSQFPIFFLIALPAYLLHEIGYLNIAGFLLFAWLLPKIFKSNYYVSLLTIVGMAAYIPWLWEMATRSTLLVNMLLVILYGFYIEKTDFNKKNSIMWFGFLGGLVLATRSIVAIPMVIQFISLLERKKLAYFILFLSE